METALRSDAMATYPGLRGRAHLALVVAEPGMQHLEKLLGRQSSRRKVDGGRAGTKRGGWSEAPSPQRGWRRGALRTEGPTCSGCSRRHPGEKLLLGTDLRILSRGQRSSYVTRN